MSARRVINVMYPQASVAVDVLHCKSNRDQYQLGGARSGPTMRVVGQNQKILRRRRVRAEEEGLVVRFRKDEGTRMGTYWQCLRGRVPQRCSAIRSRPSASSARPHWWLDA